MTRPRTCRDRIGSSEEDDRDSEPASLVADRLRSIEVGKHDVENDEVGLPVIEGEAQASLPFFARVALKPPSRASS